MRVSCMRKNRDGSNILREVLYMYEQAKCFHSNYFMGMNCRNGDLLDGRGREEHIVSKVSFLQAYSNLKSNSD